MESTNPRNPSDGLYRFVALNFHLFLCQAQHGAETKQHHKNDVQFRHPSRLKSSKNEEISTCIQNKEANVARPLGKRPLQRLFSIFKLG